MLALQPHLQARLQGLAALAGWSVRHGEDLQERTAIPAAVYACRGATAESQRSGAVMVAPVWTVSLTVARTDTGAAALDAALNAVIEALHGWQPAVAAGQRGWEPLALARITEPQYADAGLLGYVLTFTTSGLYRGQQ